VMVVAWPGRLAEGCELWLVSGGEPWGFVPVSSTVALGIYAMSKGFYLGVNTTCETLWDYMFMAGDPLSRPVVGSSVMSVSVSG